MSNKQDAVFRVGDIVEFHRRGNPQPQPEWLPQIVTEIRIVDEYEDKEGTLVSEASWHAIWNYDCLVVVVGTDNWGRNEDVRPILVPRSTGHS